MADGQAEKVKEALSPGRRSSGDSLKSRAAKKVLVPLAASAASAAASYAARKVPELLQEKVMPKVREAGGIGALAQRVWERVTSRLSDVPQHAEQEQPAAKQPAGDGDAGSAEASRETPARALSTEERERRRRERDVRRRERRKAASTS